MYFVWRDLLINTCKIDTKTEEVESLTMNKLMEQEQENQDKITNDMLKSMRAIKENSLLANRIIKSDNKVCEFKVYLHFW